MEEVQQNQLRLVVYPMICKVLAPSKRWLGTQPGFLVAINSMDIMISWSQQEAFQEDARDDRYSHPPFARCIPASQFSTANIVKNHSQGGLKKPMGIQGLWRSKEGASADVCFFRTLAKKCQSFQRSFVSHKVRKT